MLDFGCTLEGFWSNLCNLLVLGPCTHVVWQACSVSLVPKGSFPCGLTCNKACHSWMRVDWLNVQLHYVSRPKVISIHPKGLQFSSRNRPIISSGVTCLSAWPTSQNMIAFCEMGMTSCPPCPIATYRSKWSHVQSDDLHRSDAQ